MSHGLKVKVNEEEEEMEEKKKNKVITRDSLKSYIVFAKGCLILGKILSAYLIII